MKPFFLEDTLKQKKNNKDWKFGADNGIIKTEIPNLGEYLPTFESQRFLNFDPWWCVVASGLNFLEAKFNYIIHNQLTSYENIVWLNQEGYIDEHGCVNFDDWYSARKAGVVPGKGTSFRAGGDALRKGLVPQSKSPFPKCGYYDPIPKELDDIAKEFKKRFQINYERVYRKDFEEALRFGPIQVGVSSWRTKGEYYISSGRIIHATLLFDQIPWEVFDSYSPFIKQLHPDYTFMDYGYQFYISDVKYNSLISKIMDMFLRLKNGAIYFLKQGTNKVQKITPENAGLAAITYITRRFPKSVKHIKDSDLKDYQEAKFF